MKKHTSVAIGFLALIVAGAIALAMPWSRNDGQFGDWSSSLFTACSAVCVTGLTVVDIAAVYSRIGQIVLMVLVELGCLGLMTFGTFLMIAVGRRISLSSEFSLKNAYGVEHVQGLRGLIVWVVGSMLAIESLGAVALYWRLHDWYLGVFYSVMSFCNAGFSILPGSAAAFAHDRWTLLIMAALTILGGIGFLVIFNLSTFWFLRRKSGGKGRLSLHSRVVLRFTVVLLLSGFVVFMALEWNAALAGFASAEKCFIAFYQAVTPRTCGFAVIPTETLQPLTRMLYEILMFIGGAPGSAAAGIKVTTLAVLIYTLRAMCRGDNETIISRRVISYDTIREAIVIFMALVTLVILTIAALLLTESGSGMTNDCLFFEAVSAITTTGLSIGDTTARLSANGRLVIMVAMFIGRLGALTVVMMIGDREVVRHVRYPSEELVVG